MLLFQRFTYLPSKLHRYVNKVRKLYHAQCKCNNKQDPKIINFDKMAIPKRAYLLSFCTSRQYHRIMKLKCKARRYLSLFSCNCVSHMTNYVNFKLSKDVEKNPGPTQYNTDHHEVIIRPFMQNHTSTMQLIHVMFTCFAIYPRKLQISKYWTLMHFHWYCLYNYMNGGWTRQ